MKIAIVTDDNEVVDSFDLNDIMLSADIDPLSIETLCAEIDALLENNGFSLQLTTISD